MDDWRLSGRTNKVREEGGERGEEGREEEGRRGGEGGEGMTGGHWDCIPNM